VGGASGRHHWCGGLRPSFYEGLKMQMVSGFIQRLPMRSKIGFEGRKYVNIRASLHVIGAAHSHSYNTWGPRFFCF
jgi:hypothetical protein